MFMSTTTDELADKGPQTRTHTCQNLWYECVFLCVFLTGWKESTFSFSFSTWSSQPLCAGQMCPWNNMSDFSFENVFIGFLFWYYFYIFIVLSLLLPHTWCLVFHMNLFSSQPVIYARALLIFGIQASVSFVPCSCLFSSQWRLKIKRLHVCRAGSMNRSLHLHNGINSFGIILCCFDAVSSLFWSFFFVVVVVLMHVLRFLWLHKSTNCDGQLSWGYSAVCIFIISLPIRQHLRARHV